MSSRSEVVKLATSWLGKNEKDGSYKEIIDIYNAFKGPFPRNTKMAYNYAWCACTWSAIAIRLGYTDIMPIEISCGYLIEAAKKMGCWQENDGYVPKPADGILYDWDDDGVGDNAGWPDHIGLIETVNKDAGYFTVIEGNYNDSVKKRTILINGKYIRGFITPKYTDDSTPQYDLSVKNKDVTAIAKEVIVGLWGNEPLRRIALEGAGFNYTEVKNKVNEILNTPKKPTSTESSKKEVATTCYATTKDLGLSGTYTTTANLYCRNDAGTNKKALCLIPKGTKVNTYGFYSISNGVKWLLIEVTVYGIKYTGFSSISYLKKG